MKVKENNDTNIKTKNKNQIISENLEKNENQIASEDLNTNKNQIISENLDTNKNQITSKDLDTNENQISSENLEKNEKETLKNTEKKEFKPLDENANNKKSKSNKSIIFLIIFISLTLLLIITLITFSIINIKSTTIAKGVSIKDIDVSELSKKDARQKVANYINSSIPEEIQLTHNDFETSLSASQLSIYFNLDKTINNAYNIGKDGNIFERNLSTLKTFFAKTNIDIDFSIDDEQLKHDLEDISTKLPDKMIDNSYYIEGNNLIITKGQLGKVVNVEESAKYIKEQIKDLNVLNNPIELITTDASPSELDLESIYNEIHKEPINAYYSQNPYVVHPSENGVDFAISLEEAKNLLNEDKNEYVIPIKILYPSVTTNMIGTEAFPDLLSEFSTKYAASNKNRTTNLILAAKKINGTVLMPGETFSYNKVVGERTIQAGYKEAPIYVSGRVEDGIGGGICQITTTLYNAVLYANLDIVERTNHQFVPSYAGASRDATVVYGAIDFKFKNNRDYPIKITCSVSGGIANFKIFGLKSDNDYQVQITSRTTSTTATAIYSEAYKILKKNGNVVSTTLLSKDTYKRH